MAMESQKWMLVLPPEGAARQVGEKAWESLCSSLPVESRKLFDTKQYLDGFDGLLKQPTDDMVVDLVNQALVVQCLDFAATHLLVLALAPVTRFTVTLLRRQNIVTLHWFYEDFRQAKYWKDVLPAYQHFLAIQKGPIPAECQAAGSQFHYLPTAFLLPTRSQVRPRSERKEGIAFIGFPSTYRVEVLEALVKAGLPVIIAGAGWEKYRGPLEAYLTGNGWFGPEQASTLLEDATIGLHLPSEDPGVDRDNCHISPRVFDILAAGCLLLSEDAPLIRETLQNCEYRSFSGPVEAVLAARLALKDKISIESVAKNRLVVLAKHTFANRMAYILSLGD
jgi:hypothetical protein